MLIFLYLLVDYTRLIFGEYPPLLPFLIILAHLLLIVSLSLTIILCSFSGSASRGNKTSQMVPLIIASILGVPLIILHAYFISLQTYVYVRPPTPTLYSPSPLTLAPSTCSLITYPICCQHRFDWLFPPPDPFINPPPCLILIFLNHRLRVDVVTNAIALFLLSSELVLGLFTLIIFFYHSRRF